MNLRDHKKFLGELQSIWGAYKIGGEVSLTIYFLNVNSLEWQIIIGVRKNKYRCIAWIKGNTPMQAYQLLVEWIEKDRVKHNQIK